MQAELSGDFKALKGGCPAANPSRHSAAFGIVLGHAIAHELGHLLIPGDAHGNGIMRPYWAYREWQQALGGTLLFGPGPARAIRETLQPR